MAYMNQEKKKRIATGVKRILDKYGVKGSLSVNNHSTLVLNIRSGPIDFISDFNDTVSATPRGFGYGSRAQDYIDVNPYWYHEHFSGRALEFLTEIMVAMNDGNHNNSRSEIDYFDRGWYVDVNIGNWRKPYQLTA